MTNQAAAPKDAESFWAGFLSLFRAIILGRRLPPDQLRGFLLFAKPVPYLSAAQVATLLGDDGTKDGLDEPLAEGWTLGPAVNNCECCEMHNYEAQVFGETVRNLLRSEHPEWGDEWKTTFACDGHEYLSYRVLSRGGEVHPIACWMEGKLKLINEGAITPDAQSERAVALYFIDNQLEYLLGGEFWGEDGEDAETSAAIARLKNVAWYQAGKEGPNLHQAAQFIYDKGNWNITNFDGPLCYVDHLDQAARELGWYEKYPKKRSRKKQLFAA